MLYNVLNVSTLDVQKIKLVNTKYDLSKICKDIAEELGCDHTVISTALKNMGIDSIEIPSFLVTRWNFKEIYYDIKKTKPNSNFGASSEINVSSSKFAPLAICAFIILSVSSKSVGINLKAMDIIIAISCTGTFIFLRGPMSFSKASDSLSGVVVNVSITLVIRMMIPGRI